MPTEKEIELLSLREPWEEVFGEPMPMGFEITGDQVHIIRQCIDQKSQKPLEDYVNSLPADEDY